MSRAICFSGPPVSAEPTLARDEIFETFKADAEEAAAWFAARRREQAAQAWADRQAQAHAQTFSGSMNALGTAMTQLGNQMASTLTPTLDTMSSTITQAQTIAQNWGVGGQPTACGIFTPKDSSLTRCTCGARIIDHAEGAVQAWMQATKHKGRRR